MKIEANDKISGRPIRCNQKTLQVQKGRDYAEILFIGDVHLGSPECDEERFLRMLDYALKNRVYVALMGDLLECATRYSVGAGVYEQIENPQTQYERVCEMLRPLADQGLILFSLEGNHEDRIYKISGVNIAKAICRELHVPFLGAAGWNLWRVGSQKYRIYALHGSSGSRFVYTKLKAVVDISHSFAADIIAMGHVHECADTSILVQYVDPNGSVREEKKFLLITGHYLKYEGYAKAKGLPLAKLGSPKVKLFAGHRDIHISW